jgi:hypothetical protein
MIIHRLRRFIHNRKPIDPKRKVLSIYPVNSAFIPIK